MVGFSNEEINRFSTASLITRTTNDISQLQMFFSFGMQSLIKAPIMAFIAVGKISTKSWEWSLLTGGVIAFVCVLLVFIMLYAVPRMKKMQALTDNLNRITRENLTGLQVVRAYNAENYQEGKFAKANEEMTRNSQQANIAMSVMNPGMNLAMNGLTLGIYWIGAALISAIAVTSPAAMMERIGLFSDMVVFMQYAMQVIMAFLMLVMIFVMLPRVTVSASRVNEVLDTKARIVDGKETQGKPGMKGEIEFRDVSFRYPDADGDAIHHISFTAHHGQTVALIGATGCGKSSIINLIPRLYDATSGQVLVDGVDVRDYTQDALRSKIGFVPQKAFLFAGEEDFGITPVEAQSAGTPVLAFGRGGACETVLDGKTGLLFDEQTPESLEACIQKFETEGVAYPPQQIREHSRSFSEQRFEDELRDYCTRRYADWQRELEACSHHETAKEAEE